MQRRIYWAKDVDYGNASQEEKRNMALEVHGSSEGLRPENRCAESKAGVILVITKVGLGNMA